jgi:hypothetical protein
VTFYFCLYSPVFSLNHLAHTEAHYCPHDCFIAQIFTLLPRYLIYCPDIYFIAQICTLLPSSTHPRTLVLQSQFLGNKVVLYVNAVYS